MANHWSDMGAEGQITAAEAGDPYFASQQMERGQTGEIHVNRDAFIDLLGQRNQKAKELDAIKHEISQIKHVMDDQPTVILITIDTGEDGGNGAYANFAGEVVGSTMDPQDAVTAALFFTANKLQTSTQPADVIAFQTAYNYYANQIGASEIATDGVFGLKTSDLFDTVVGSPKFAGWVSATFGTCFGDEGQITAGQMGDPNFARNQLASGDVQQIEVNRIAFEKLFQQRAQLDHAIETANLERQALINDIH